ncbi:MAG: hypothetical protein K9I69_03695, partial [Ignavibacteriales bacterium]|nr:hypothetical protein [Ignavibacteriales bacterium]
IRYRKQMASGMNGLFASEFSDLEKNVETKDQYSISEICAIEYETFDYMVTRHPLEFFSGVINRESIIKAKDMYRYNKKEIKMVGWFMTSKRIKTKKGDIMKFLSLEDLTGTFEAVLFPETYSEYAEQTLSMGPYLLKGTVDAEAGNNLIVNKLAVLSAQDVKATARKDSSENNYYGDVEKVNPEEFSILSGLDQEKLRQAYL